MLYRLNYSALLNHQPILGRDCNPFLNAFLQSVRWKRKPIWAPVAKSKLFRIPERKSVPEDEKIEMQRLYNEYRTHYRAVRRFLFDEFTAALKESPETQHKQLDDEDISHSLKLNEEWNKEVAAIRELRVAREAKEDRDRNLEYMIQADQEAEENMKLIDSIVKEEKAKSSSFITPENLDEAIEHALANVVDYNFAIDVKGNIIYGRTGKLENVQEKNEQAAVINS